jgi:hypothetical protein
MKRKTTCEYIALILLALTTGFILYRQTGTSASLPVYAATLPPSKSVEVPITPRERQLIRTYLASLHSKPPRPVPTGLTRLGAGTRNRLGAGWEEKLVKGRILPAEIVRECSPLPKELTLRLPPAPLGTVLVAIDGKVIRVARTSFEVLDVFDTRL